MLRIHECLPQEITVRIRCSCIWTLSLSASGAQTDPNNILITYSPSFRKQSDTRTYEALYEESVASDADPRVCSICFTHSYVSQIGQKEFGRLRMFMQRRNFHNCCAPCALSPVRSCSQTVNLPPAYVFATSSPLAAAGSLPRDCGLGRLPLPSSKTEAIF